MVPFGGCNWGTEKPSDFEKITQLFCGRDRIRTLVLWLPRVLVLVPVKTSRLSVFSTGSTRSSAQEGTWGGAGGQGGEGELPLGLDELPDSRLWMATPLLGPQSPPLQNGYLQLLPWRGHPRILLWTCWETLTMAAFLSTLLSTHPRHHHNSQPCHISFRTLALG
jgi:hypothetical protein